MLDRDIEQRWSIIKESYPGGVVFQEADGLYFVRGNDTAILAKEFALESLSEWCAFDDSQAIGYMQELVERGYSVARATNCGVALVRRTQDRRSEILKQRAKGRFHAISPSLLFAPDEIERATNAMWMRRHGYDELLQRFKSWLANDDRRSLRAYGEVYVYQVADWYEVDDELTSMLETHVLLLAKAAIVTGSKLPCKVVEPRSRRNRKAGHAPRTASPAEPAPPHLGQTRFEGF
jgi:hypothetical protein